MEVTVSELDHIGEGAGEDTSSRATPVMAQFLVLKQANPGSLLFFRMGDFYELFFEDAEIAASALGITLTKRGKHMGEDIPMCGVPVHAADAYLQKLIRMGHRVAVCEQLEDPAEARKRGSKAVVKRDVVRLVTPGTLTEDNLLDSRSHNFLVSVTRNKATGDIAIAWADISSGELAVMQTSSNRLSADLTRLDPREIIAADTLLAEPEFTELLDRTGAPLTPLPAVKFDSLAAERRLKEQFDVKALEGFGSFTRPEISALGGLLEYVLITQAGKLPHFRPPRREVASSVLLIDPATRANLELTRTLGGERRGSLLSVIDDAITAAGSRCIASRLSNPLCDPYAIANRLDEVAHFVADPSLREDVRKLLARMPDLERALGRVAISRGGPRDLAAVRDGLMIAGHLAHRLGGSATISGLPENLDHICETLSWTDLDLARDLDAALDHELPAFARDGGFVKQGYSVDLDENRSLRDETRHVIAGLQARYSEISGIKSLKVKHNNVLGYFIEVPATSASLLQTADKAGLFIHRQTVASAMRFVTTELASLDQRIAAAAEKALALEQEIFSTLCARVDARRDLLSKIADASARLDAAAALAEVAERRRYVRPRVDGSTGFTVRGGRHPVVEAALQDKAAGSFVANDCDVSGDARRLCLLTGPNMAGKSTYLRQNALIVILAQMGSFVPAADAHFGVVDRLFSRVGAADDLARGRSTFMVEMVETAAILNQATERSFVILDEIGRGTATYDGLSIAWATLEHLHGENRCRALFATHYHELTQLAAKLPHLANATMKVKEWQDQIIFLHEVVAGVADRSYGIHVAQIAGLPAAVINRAQQVLERLERQGAKGPTSGLAEDLPLFAAAPAAKRESAVEKRLSGVVADELSPRDALALVYELKSLLAARQPS
ncbi:DNA mismatch repair protein MutS [Aestuariivirga litoralis]|uniref:DNA mismatch repair protein MutS n=1 Tax=Aestuariivirga litoralis TaxID=2650924 RepID=A0A2W2AY01_9HYPH|nr:DNA mismatch repair protein MutS [Aestuariivirga litoralis]PZF77460.1 DNA mismatch repair protein MutS [Aestuariivirga litoralis]